jgi:hypothetical protein
MAQRRDRPPVEHPGDSLNIKLPDGTTMSVPLKASVRAATADLCCFCGEPVADTDRPQVQIDARWEHDRAERQQSWAAHHRCLVDRMHQRVRAQQPPLHD